ncbi:hypothetical protein NDU88_002652 [Pleurodeles waltl]|uniref:Uncharacterized protein n=1 Tax=Pleurodeles waltl TaxID=8319 RepID=A0AAV7LD45_PLEWA|nr:hypothetical protein NDU88_002652 [Pleurodeles waltl]
MHRYSLVQYYTPTPAEVAGRHAGMGSSQRVQLEKVWLDEKAERNIELLGKMMECLGDVEREERDPGLVQPRWLSSVEVYSPTPVPLAPQRSPAAPGWAWHPERDGLEPGAHPRIEGWAHSGFLLGFLSGEDLKAEGGAGVRKDREARVLGAPGAIAATHRSVSRHLCPFPFLLGPVRGLIQLQKQRQLQSKRLKKRQAQEGSVCVRARWDKLLRE